ncbi:MAG TPA: hypothetical protein VI195_06645, partial [Steroidobacteraceae bacterium]
MGELAKPLTQKGAHYSVPVSCGTAFGLGGLSGGSAAPGARAARAAMVMLILATLIAPPGTLSAAASAARPESDARKAEEQLQAVKAEIERVSREVSAEQVERDRLTRELRSAELQVAQARDALSDVRHQRAEDAARRTALAAEKRAREKQLDENREALAGQMRAAYLIGRQEPFKLLLNQKDPALAGRMFAYYSYFGRARAGQIHLIEDDVRRLAELEKEQRAQLNDLEQARERRGHVLVSLEAQSRSRAQNLERLRAQQSGLE